jgi:hypothetical protein
MTSLVVLATGLPSTIVAVRVFVQTPGALHAQTPIGDPDEDDDLDEDDEDEDEDEDDDDEEPWQVQRWDTRRTPARVSPPEHSLVAETPEQIPGCQRRDDGLDRMR